MSHPKTPLGRWWRYKVFWRVYRAFMPNRTRRIFNGYWTYDPDPKRRQSGPWLDRTLISDRWRDVRALPEAAVPSEGVGRAEG